MEKKGDYCTSEVRDLVRGNWWCGQHEESAADGGRTSFFQTRRKEMNLHMEVNTFIGVNMRSQGIYMTSVFPPALSSGTGLSRGFREVAKWVQPLTGIRREVHYTQMRVLLSRPEFPRGVKTLTKAESCPTMKSPLELKVNGFWFVH